MNLESRRSRALLWAAVACLYTAVTLWYFWPLPRLWRDHIGPGLGDPVFNLYVLKWGAHQFRLGFPDVWNANLFYPTKGALTLSDHLLGPAVELALLLAVVPGSVAAYNVLFLSSFVASALAVCWMLRRAGLSWTAAVLGGGMYAFSSFRLSQTAHLQILIAQWIPPALWFWDRLLTRRTAKDAALFLLFYLLNLSGGCYLAYMIHFPLAAILAVRLRAHGRELVSARSLRVLAPVALVAAGAVAALFLPYIRVARELKLTRTAEEIQEFSALPASYVSPAFESSYFQQANRKRLHALIGKRAKLFARPENALFAGFLPTALFFVGAAAAWRRRREGPPDPHREWTRGLALSGLVCFALSFAAVYGPLARVVPGLSGMRVPARFYAFVSLAIVYFAAIGLDALLRRPASPRSRAALAALCAAVLAAELYPAALPWKYWPPEAELPRVYTWIAGRPDVRALIELPIHGDTRENEYLYAATVHWKPIANGYSGYLPPSHQALTETIRFLPHPDGFELLREMGITHLVVHAGRKPGRGEVLERWERRFARGPERQVEAVYREPGIAVFRLLP